MKALRPFARFLVGALLAGAVCCGVAQPVASGKAIRIVVPYGAGGTADQTARIVGQKMAASLGQPVVIDNRPGAGAVVAATSVSRSDPDGATLLLIGNSSALTPLLFKSLPYDVFKDFSYVGSICYFDFGLIVSAYSPFRTVADLVDYARANPGKLNLGTLTPGTTQHLAGELFKSTAGIRLQTVPFKSSSESITALRGKGVDAAFEVIAPLLGQIRAGQLRVLGVASVKPLPQLPDVPVIGATLPGFNARSWNGLAVPARTPPAAVDRLHKALADALADPDVTQRLLALGVEPVSMTPEQTRGQIEADMRKWKSVIEHAGIERQ
jgi:tripartite-type tricarboxylate transporter receptor subunit TctC